ncbi:MAG: permease [Firmicutes bacterium]|nr:permease [Bacillota bacterium]
MGAFTLAFYSFSLVALFASLLRDKARTKEALRKAWKAFENILPQFLGVIVLVGIILALLSPATIGRLLGRESGWAGVFLAAIVGAVTLIPGFVAFPLAAMLLRAGAGPMQMGAFISALMMVGIVTAPVEMKYFGRRMTFFRNGLAFLYSFLVAWVIGMVVKR